MPVARTALALIAAVALAACSTPPVVNNNRDQPAGATTVGTTQTITGGKVTLHELRDKVARDGYTAPAGKRWVGIDAEICVDETSQIDGYRWQLHDTNNHTYTISISGNDLPAADYRTGVLNGGTCMRGWLAYAVPTTETISNTTYTGGNGTVLTWK